MKIAVALMLALAACGGDDAHETPDAPVPHDAAPDADPCACTFGAPVAKGVASNFGTSELSGLAASRTIAGLFWAQPDSGASAKVFSLHADASPGPTLQLTDLAPTDVEDIAIGPCDAPETGSCIFLADTGDNDENRTMVSLYSTPEPATEAPNGIVQVPYHRYDIQYPDGAHNVEALVVDPRDGATYIFTKVTSGAAGVYAMPRMDGVVATAVKLGAITIPVGTDRRITAADMFTDDCGTKILVRTRDGMFQLSGDPTTPFAEMITKPLVAVPSPVEPQGEAVAWETDGRAYDTISEGGTVTLWRVACQ